MAQDSWIGKTINNRYQIETLLGKGGMSSVYKATDPNLRREVAIKLIHSHLSDDPEFVRRFEEEAAAVARLRHPNIIQVHDFDHDGDTYYIVFEYIPGESLQERLKRLSASGERVLLAETLKIITSMGEALAYAHEAGLVHRDIKPANIMLNKREEAILMDFGIAKISGISHKTATGMVLGTARYMSPEQVMGERIDSRTDIYALGVTLFEMVNGRPPFESDSVAALMMKHVNEPVPDLQKLRPDVPPSLVAVIDKALAKNREERYQTAAELASDLQVVAGATAAGTTTAKSAVTPGTATAKSAVAPGQETVNKSIAADVTILETADYGSVKSAESPAAPATGAGNNRLLLIGGAVLAFLLIAACAIFAISTIRGSTEPAADTAALNSDDAAIAESLPLSEDAGAAAESGVGSADAPNGSDVQSLQVSGDADDQTTTAVDQLAGNVKKSIETDNGEKGAVPAAAANFDPLFLTSYSYDGLIISLAVPGTETQRVLFSIDDPQPKIDNGTTKAGSLTLANNSIGPIPHDKGEHTLYVQFVDANDVGGEIYSFDYKIDDIVFNFTMLPYDFETESSPAFFTMFIIEGDTEVLYSYAYSVDSETLDQTVDGVAEAGVVQVPNLAPGDHVLYVRATGPTHQTGVVAFPFTIE